jgi:hypothetical protein
MTTQADESWNDLGPDVKHHEHQMSVKVEIEGFGYRLMQLDQLNRANVYEQVAVTISSLRDDILRSVNKDYLGQSLTPRDRGIVAYKTMKEPEAGVMLPFNSGFLVGAVEELNTGFYTKLLVFATFVLPQTGEEQTQATIVLERSNMDKDMRHNPARFPSIETVLEIPRPSISHIWPQHCCHPTEGHSSSWSVKWISENFIRCPVGHSSAHVLMLDGPQWIEKQAIAKGGSSTVYKVKISPLFHSWVGDLDTFALKVLKPEHKHTFERELQAHIQLASKNNPHIVPLLMAYERDSHFHLLFPLADGTLKDLFHHCNAHSSLEISSWTGLQLAALAGALETIHVAKFHHSLKTSMAESRIVHFGTHGDLKPSNILCFPGSHGLGILKLSDFGLTRLRSHDLKRRSVNLEKGVTGTLGYLAPDPISSTASDIWSLGCILLEALTWLAGGPQSLVSLHSARLVIPSLNQMFYNFNTSSGSKMVTDVATLRIRMAPFGSIPLSVTRDHGFDQSLRSDV